jgi:hypothetical protein
MALLLELIVQITHALIHKCISIVRKVASLLVEGALPMETADGSESELGDKPISGEISALKIVADVAASFTYASYQNAIPVLRSVSIENNSDQHFENCRLELTSSPPFLWAKTWTVDRLIPGDKLAITDRKIELDAAYLSGLNEAERGEIILRLSSAGETIDEQRITVRLLARDEWGGVADMAQLLPAFVMPNDPSVAQILRTAAERLVAHGHPSGLDGYQSESPQRAYMLTAAIYSAIAAMGLHYAEPPASFESRGQKIRRPSRIAEERLATCLDITLLFAAAIEATGLHPIILMFDGHAAAGVWLTKRTFSNAIETDHMEVRKALVSRELTVPPSHLKAHKVHSTTGSPKIKRRPSSRQLMSAGHAVAA